MWRGMVAPGKRTVLSGKSGSCIGVSLGRAGLLAQHPAGTLLVACLHEDLLRARQRRHAERGQSIAALHEHADALDFQHILPDAGLELVVSDGEEYEVIITSGHGTIVTKGDGQSEIGNGGSVSG